MTNPAGSFIWYELMTRDARAASDFYGRVVGWTIPAAAPAGPDGKDYRMVLRSDGNPNGGMLQLTDAMCEQGARSTWLAYLYVTDVDATVKAIEADGGRTLLPAMDLPVGRIAMVADPLGTPFYVMKPVPPPDDPGKASDVFAPRVPQHVTWNELSSPDLARAKAFYAKHFGFRFDEVMPMGKAGDYCFIDHGQGRLGGMMQVQGDAAQAGWRFYFGVESAGAAARAIEAAGGQVVRAPHQTPDGSWILHATDPQGASFGVVAPEA